MLHVAGWVLTLNRRMTMDKSFFPAVLLGGLIPFAFFVCSCRGNSGVTAREQARIIPAYPPAVDHTESRKLELSEYRLEADLIRLRSFSGALVELEKEMENLRKTVGLKERGYYTSDEHDQIESLLFRYLACRESLWDMIGFYSAYKNTFPTSEHQTRGFLIGFGAAVELSYYSSKLVATFLNGSEAIDKLNEAYYRLDIPEGTYHKLFNSVTSLDNLQALKTAWLLYSNERADPDSTLSRISESDSVYRELMDRIDGLYAKAKEQTDYILKERSLLFPNIRNRLRHARIFELATQAKGKIDDNLYAARGVLFERVSRVKSPLAAEIKFSTAQVEQIKSILLPGDVILTFSEGYMSNIFLPGKFKHGITYVGSPEQRQAAGMTLTNLSHVSSGRLEDISEHLDQAKLPSGDNADLIEGIAEGVVFSSLDHILETHINRLLILRPRLSDDERVGQLTTVFLLLGNNYDFKFDFSNASFHCCTEVIYRALHKRGPIEFSLVPRMGKQTLSADDIIKYHLSTEDKPFEFILLAEEDPGASGHQAIIRTGPKGEKRFFELMGSEDSP
jgi:hypothetical protein